MRPDRHRRRSVLRSEVVFGVTTSGCAACTQPPLRPSEAGAHRSDRLHLFRVPWRRRLPPFRGRSALWVRVVRPPPVARCPALAPHRVLQARQDIHQEHLGHHLGHRDNLEVRRRRFLARVLQGHLRRPLPDSLVAHHHRGLLDNRHPAWAIRHQHLASAIRHRGLLGIRHLASAIRHRLLAWASHWKGEGSSGRPPSANLRWEPGIRSAPEGSRHHPRPNLPGVLRPLRSARRPQQLPSHPFWSSRSEPPVAPSWPQRARAESKHANPTNACHSPFANCIEIFREPAQSPGDGKRGRWSLPPFRDLCILLSFL